MAVFWVVAPCNVVEVYQRFRGLCCLHHHPLIALMVEAASTSETLVNFYQTTRNYNPEDSHLPSVIYHLMYKKKSLWGHPFIMISRDILTTVEKVYDRNNDSVQYSTRGNTR
jgi:hypothetical protein